MSNAPEVYIDVGRLLQFSTGSYSDYSVGAIYVTLRPILYSDLEAAKAEAESRQAENKAEWGAWYAGASGRPHLFQIHESFQTALIERGFLMIVDCAECHIGDYGRLEIPTKVEGME